MQFAEFSKACLSSKLYLLVW